MAEEKSPESPEPVANPEYSPRPVVWGLTNPNSYRVQVWREANRDRYNARQKELMRRRRSKGGE